MLHPESIVDFEVYEDSVNFVGIAQVTLPNINYLTQDITGAGISGTVEAVLIGMIDKMNATFNFRSATDAAIRLLKPEKHLLDLRVAEQHWDSVGAQRTIQADKYIMGVIPKNFAPGNVTPATTSDANGEYSVYYYAAYKDGKQIWEIDQFNYICKIGGVDYMAEVRKALGK